MAGRYITEQHVYDLFGQSNVVKWATVQTAGYGDVESRLQAAIEWAESEIEGRFRGGQYAVPFAMSAADMKTVERWMAFYAAYWLRAGRGIDEDKKDHIAEQKKDVDADILAYLMGAREFALGKVDDTGPTAPQVP